MLYPVGAPSEISLAGSVSQEVLCVTANRERSLLAVLTPDSISVLSSHPLASLLCLSRDEKAREERGLHVRAVWKPDSSAICVVTSKQCLELYRLGPSAKASPSGVYVEREPSDAALRKTSQDLFAKAPLPAMTITLSLVVRLSAPAASVLALREELVVFLEDGFAHRLLWNGQVLDELTFHLSKLPFAADQLQSKPAFLEPSSAHHRSKLFVRDAAYSPLIGGFALALSSGKGALLTSPTPKFPPGKLLAVWAPGMTDARVVAVNHKYRLLTFGCANGEVAAYHLEEMSGALILAYRVRLEAKDNLDGGARLGAVTALSWSPYGSGVLVAWSKSPVLGLFSVFGAQVWSSADADDWEAASEVRCRSLDWGPEGFQAFLAQPEGLRAQDFLRSIAVNNPMMEGGESMVLLSSEGLWLSPEASLEASSVWTRLRLPCEYMAGAWPLRYAAVAGPLVVVAGTRGLAHTSLAHSSHAPKWRLFGNESQETELVVSGGLGIWPEGGVIIAACYDLERGRDDVRFYPLGRQLDNAYATHLETEAQVISFTLRQDVLVTFDVEARVSLFQLKAEAESRVSFTRLAEVLIADVVFNPGCVVSVRLTSLGHAEDGAEFAPGADSLLVNTAGRLIMLSPQRPGPKLSPPLPPPYADAKSKAPQQLQTPLVVASYVEQVWHESFHGPHAPASSHLRQSLWLQCGCRGMKVWLPLLRSKSGPHPLSQAGPSSFISKRIMLPFHLDVLPLLIRSADCLGLGVSASGGSRSRGWSVARKAGLFLHELLKQLLKRNLGLYALEIASTCRDLDYFGHVMELLLHKVLEEETTSSEPIPDPLLPRVVAFIQEFPEFLATVGHCARKTEQTHWQHLFASAGNPSDLFAESIRRRDLSTAASFLIVLQNMESPNGAKDSAMELLQACLEGGDWLIAREIVRFLKAIHPDDIDSPPRTPLFGTKAPVGPRLSLASPVANEAATFVFQPPMVASSRQRHSSLSSPLGLAEKAPSTAKKATAQAKASKLDSSRRNSSLSSSHGEPSPESAENPIALQLDATLRRFARQLLASGRLAELGSFAAHLDFHLVLWLAGERQRAARVLDFPAALARLHCDFAWPYPILRHSLVQSLQRRMAGLAGPGGLRKPTPLQVITGQRRESSDSGVRTLELSSAAGAEEAPSLTKALLMRQNLTLSTQAPPPLPAQLQPHSKEAEERSADRQESICGSEVTEDSWATPASPGAESGLDWEGLELLCGEAAARGSPAAEARLRFLQQLMGEAACVEWSLLLCLILRDFVGLGRALTPSALALAGPEAPLRLAKGLARLEDWADSNCIGYKPILQAVARHVDAVVAAPPPPTGGLLQQASSEPSLSGPATPTPESHPSARKTNSIQSLPHSASQPIAVSAAPGERIHVDIVSPMTPTKQEEGSCSLM